MADVLLDRPGLVLTRAGATRRIVLHCAPRDAAAIGRAIGVELAEPMLRVASSGGWRALHLAPDEWLLIGAAQDPGALRAPAADLPPCSLVDVSARDHEVVIVGPLVAALLAAGCPLDLSPAATPLGACTRTLLGKATVVLERDAACFRIHYARSFEDYVLEFLGSASEDLPQARTG